MEKLLQKRLVRMLIIVYLLSYILHDVFFLNLQTAHAEDVITNTNLVAIIVDQDIYSDLDSEIKRYATDYVQQKISDSKAIVLPIDINNFKAPDIVKILENMYFDGLEDEPSKLAGLVLIGDIPLPVVEQNTFIYPSIYPYVDFEKQKFIYDADKGFFAFNDNNNGEAEVWHGIINYEDSINKYKDYFEKLRDYDDSPSDFISDKIRYDDFVATKEYFLTDNITYYVNNSLFTEDVGYHRLSNLLLDILKGEHQSVVAGVTEDFINGMDDMLPSNSNDYDDDEENAEDFGGTIQDLLDTFNSIMGDMEEENNNSPPLPSGEPLPPKPMKSPTLMLQSMINEFLKSYDTLLATKYLTRMRDNVASPARRYNENSNGDLTLSFDSHYNKIVQNDTWAFGNPDISLPPLLIEFNNQMEEALNQKIEDEEYYMHIPLITSYYDRSLPRRKKKRRSLVENFYFGENSKNIKTAQEFSAYRGTYENNSTISGLSNIKTTQSIGSTYDIFSQQIEANRGYNLRNAAPDSDLFEQREGKKKFAAKYYDGGALVNTWKIKASSRKQKKGKSRDMIITDEDGKGTSEGGQDVINKNRGGATPLNYDIYGRLQYYSYKDARKPIYDIAGSYTIDTEESDAYSFLGILTYSSFFKTKIDNGERAYIYPRAMKDKDEDETEFRDQAEIRYTTMGDEIAFVPKKPGTYAGGGYADYFSVYSAYGSDLEDDDEKYQFQYKTVDSRIYNISPTREQISGRTVSEFGNDSDIDRLYKNIKDEINGVQNNIITYVSGYLEAIQTGKNKLDNLSSEIANINSTNALANSGNLSVLINGRDSAFTMDTILEDIVTSRSGLIEMNEFLISSEAEEEYFDDWKVLFQSRDTTRENTIYGTNLGLGGIEELINEYKVAHPNPMPFNTMIISPKQIRMESGAIDDLNDQITNTRNSFNNIPGTITTFQNIQNTASSEVGTYISSLSGKQTDINNLQICGTNPNTYPCGCTYVYSTACDMIDTIISRLTNVQAELGLINDTETKTIEHDVLHYYPIPPESLLNPFAETGFEVIDNDSYEYLYSTTPIDYISVGITYHNNGGLAADINNAETIINSFTRINDTSSLPEIKQGGMDITTQDRPIDNIRNVTFQGIGGGLVQFNYPNLYEVETYDQDGDILTLKSAEDISTAIRNYLTGKVKEYNQILQTQLDNKTTFYNFNSKAQAFNTLGLTDSLANPISLRPYNMMPDDFFITEIGDEAVEVLGKTMYYQNITRQEKRAQSQVPNVVDDINEIKAAFDINKKTSYITNNYLIKDNDQGPFITPTYSPGGYEIAFINSDGKDYIKAKPTPTFIKEIQTIQESRSNRYVEAPEESDFEKKLDEICDFDPSGSELIFDIETSSSPWYDAFECRLEETMKTPFEIKIDFSNAMGPTINNFVGDIDQSLENRSGSFGKYASQRGALDTQAENEETINTAPIDQQDILKNILTYSNVKFTANGQDEATARQLGDQTSNKQIKISSSRDLGGLDIHVTATGDNCFQIKKGGTTIANNACTTEELTFNPFSDNQDFDITPNGNAGTTILSVAFCLPDTDYCIRKATKIEILPDMLDKVEMQLVTTTVLAGGEIPFIIQGRDQYDNNIGFLAPEGSIYTDNGKIRNGGFADLSIPLSNFNNKNLGYRAPVDVDDEITTNIYFSGVGGIGTTSPTITDTQEITVIEGFLDIKYDGDTIFEDNDPDTTQPIEFSLIGAEDIIITDNDGNTSTDISELPSITLKLRRKNGTIISDLESPALVSTQKRLLQPGKVEDSKFKKTGSFIIKNGSLEIYLYPSFKAGDDTLYISIPGIDTIKIPVHIAPGEADQVDIQLDQESATPGEDVGATITIMDQRDNIIDEETTLRLGTIGALTLNGNDSIDISTTGKLELEIETKEPGGEGFLFAYIKYKNIEDQTPGYKDILVQNTLLPTTGLNIMYLNLRGTDRGNQRGYSSDKKQYIPKLMDQSEKLLTVTTQIMDPSKLKSTDIIITQNAQVKNLADKEIFLEIQNEHFIIDIQDIGTVDIGNIDDFDIQQDDGSGNIADLLQDETKIIYIPEITDSIITSNELQNKKILINQEEVFNLSDGILGNNAILTLSPFKKDNYSVRELLVNEQKVGELILARDDTILIDNISSHYNISNIDYDTQKTFAEASTNGQRGIAIYQKESSFASQGYKSIEDNDNSTLGLGFTASFKNIHYFGNGKSVGESTLPFASEFLINFGDPLLTKVSDNPTIKGTDFDGGLGEPIYTDPDKTIFKVLPIDFNNDGLEDIITVYKDGVIRLMKNYGGNEPYKHLQDLTIIADSIKEVIVGDVDNNQYPDIIIWTANNKLKIYKNQEGIFDVDGYLGCINTNTKMGNISNTPDDLGQVAQIFFEDMDDDGNLDIITNDNRNDIKIFYGGADSDDNGYYISKLTYTCDDERYERQEDNMQIVRSLGVEIDKDRYIQNGSLIRREGLLMPVQEIEEEEYVEDEGPFDENDDGRKDRRLNNKDKKKKDKQELKDLQEMGEQMAEDSENEATTFVNDLVGYINQGLEGFTQYVASPTDILPIIDDDLDKEEIAYIPLFNLDDEDTLSGDDEATAYKQFEDLNGDILEPNDIVRVTTTIGAFENSTFTYLENIQLPPNSQIHKDHKNRIVSFRFATGTDIEDLIVHRDVSEKYDFMMDNIELNAGEKIVFYYEFIYGGTTMSMIDVKDDEIVTQDLGYVSEQGTYDGEVTLETIDQTRSRDNTPDIIFYPTNSCKKYKLTLFNTDQGDNKEYDEVFFNIQKKIDDENAALRAATQDNLNDTNSAVAQTANLDEILDMPGMDSIFESRDSNSVLNATLGGGGGGMNINTDFIDQSTAGIQQKMDDALGGMCQGFTIGKNKGCQGVPIPFNQGFLAPGQYHLFGCIELSALDSTLGKGLPVLAFPTSCGPVPIRPPCPANAGAIFGGSNSQVRVYAVPTLTMGMGIAICLGPYSLGKALPKVFRNIGGNCIVMAIPPITVCDDPSQNGGESDQIIDPSLFETSQNGSCNTPAKPTNNVIIFTSNTTDSNNGVIGTTSEWSADSPMITLRGQNVSPADQQQPLMDTWDGNFFGLSLNQKPISVRESPQTDTSNIGGSPSVTFDFGGEEAFNLNQGDKINLKMMSSITKGLIKCIKDRCDKQILYIINNMTKMTVGITFPDLSQLGAGFNKLSIKNLKKATKGENDDTTQSNNDTEAIVAKKAKDFFSQKNYQSRANTTSNPFDAVMMMFKEVPLINISTKDINIQIPIISSEDITKYIAYLEGRYEINKRILEKRLHTVNAILAFCGRVSKEDAPKMIEDLEKEKKAINAMTGLDSATKSRYIENISGDIKDLKDILALTGGQGTGLKEGRKKYAENPTKYLANNFELTMQKVAQLPRLKAVKLKLETKRGLSDRTNINFTAEDEALLDIVNTRYEQVNKCGDFVNGLGGFLKFYTNTTELIRSIKENIKVLEQYKRFPLQLYERIHVTERYLTEISSIASDFLGSIMYWITTNANRFEKYVDAMITLVNVMKTRQTIIDFSTNRSKKCGKCTNDDYTPQSCSLSFICPDLPVLKIPNFRIPNIYVDLSHINLGIDIVLPNFNFKPISITLPKIPNIPKPPEIAMFLDFEYKYGEPGIDLDIGFTRNLSVPSIPILPSPPQLPELPSFIPNVKVTLPVIPPAPRIPKLSSKIELSIEIAEFIAKLYCIMKGGIGLVGEKGIKSKVEQITQRTRSVPVFDYFDMTADRKEEPNKGFDYKLDAYLELKYNFDGFYSFLNNVVEPINSLSQTVQGVTQTSIDPAQERIDESGLTEAFEDIETFNIPDLTSYRQDDEEETLYYKEGLQELKSSLLVMKNKAEETNAIQTLKEIDHINADINKKSDINPAYEELNLAEQKTLQIIDEKQQKIKKINEQIKNEYNEFLKSLEENTIQLVKEEGFSTTITSPLFTTNTETKTLISKQENPNKTYVDLNKGVIDGYIDILKSKSPEQLNMSSNTHQQSKQYLEEINTKIEKIAFAGTAQTFGQNVSTTSTTKTKAPELLLTQSPPPPCPNCPDPQPATSYSPDLSQFVRGVFVEVYSGDEKLMVNTVKSTENVNKIGKNYATFDINKDEKDDIIMRDANTVYIKYAEDNNEYEDSNFDNTYYVYDNGFDSPEDIRNESDDGYVRIKGLDIKLADETLEVKNFKMQGQDFESISFGWLNSALQGDKPDGYLIKLNQRIDTFNDKGEWEKYEADEEQINKKYILILPEGVDITGGLISLKDGFSDKKPITSFLTGSNTSYENTILEVKEFDPGEIDINITLTEIPRTRQYAQITTLTKHQEKLSSSQARRLSLYEISGPWSNQIVAGRQLIADTKGPIGEFSLYRPQIDEIVSEGDTMDGFLSTRYEIHADWTDNVAVQFMWIEKDDEFISIQSGQNQTGKIILPDLFFTGEDDHSRFFGAQDFNGNITREEVILNIKSPDITIIGTNPINDESTEVIAELSNDVDEGNVIFQRLRNSIRQEMTGTNSNSYGGFSLTGRQTIITGGVFSIGKEIGLYNLLGEEIGSINPENGEIQVDNDYDINIDFSSHIPLIQVKDGNTILFQINLPTQELNDIQMTQGSTNYEKMELEGESFGIFNGGYCIKTSQDDCMIFMGAQGEIYIPTPYHSSLKANYDFDEINEQIIYQFMDQLYNEIANIHVTFKPNK